MKEHFNIFNTFLLRELFTIDAHSYNCIWEHLGLFTFLFYSQLICLIDINCNIHVHDIEKQKQIKKNKE